MGLGIQDSFLANNKVSAKWGQLHFDAAQQHGQSTHVGMKIMQERAARIGAQVRVQSERG